MYHLTEEAQHINQRVRAILLTGNNTILFIKRLKPHHSAEPYWVAPGGGVERYDQSLMDTLERELCEELGATATVVDTAFILEHEKAGKQLEEHFFVCKLEHYDLALRHGPEFDDPDRGQYLPEEILLDETELQNINIKTPEMREWIIDNLDFLRAIK